MSFEPGSRLGSFEITDRLGAGGMGEVYRARDLKLERDVAIKMLPRHLSTDAELRARLEREARLLATVNHPNIGSIYGLEESDGHIGLVLELVSGATLESYLVRGPLPVPAALRIARQIAGALQAAHDKGIVHRDLKPANVMLQGDPFAESDVQAKVLDFGLATLDRGNDTQSATATSYTMPGTVLGTPSYMSPEQARGFATDRRTDIWAFGCVLFEMLSGRIAFRGQTGSDTIAAILEREPDWSVLPDRVWPGVRRVLQRCLRKDQKQRFHDIADVVLAIEDAGDTPAPPRSRVRTREVAFAVGLAVGALGCWALFSVTPRVPASTQSELTRLTADPSFTTQPNVSLDGKFITYASDRSSARERGGQTDVWFQQVAGGEAIRLTQHPADDYEPSFSPDGSKIVFRSDRDGGGLYVVSSLGGEPRFLTRGGHFPRYSPDGTWIAYWDGEPASGILFVSGDARMFMVRAEGGAPVPFRHDFAVAYPPVWSGDGRFLLFWGQRKASDAGDWWAAPVDDGEPIATGAGEALRSRGLGVPLLVSAITADARWLFSSGRNLWQLPFDPVAWRTRGAPELVTFGTSNERHPSTTNDGRIVFESGRSEVQVWSVPLDANRITGVGTPLRLTTGVAVRVRPSVSSDGTQVVFGSDRSGSPDVWLLDVPTGAERALTTSDAQEESPVLSPDATRVAYEVDEASGSRGLFVAPVSGGAAQGICVDCRGWHQWSPDGSALVSLARRDAAFIAVYVGADGREIWQVRHSRFGLFGPRRSPDGRWLAVSVNQGQGRASVWVVPIRGTTPAAEADWIRITDEASFADKQDWSPDGNVLYYYSKQDGFGCLYAQRLSPVTKQPEGAAVVISHWHGASQSLHDVGLGRLNVTVARDKIVFNLAEQSGNVWLLKPSWSR